MPRIAKVVIPKENFNSADLFKEGHKIKEGLPEDATFYNFMDYPARPAYVFLFESEEFEEVDELTLIDDVPEVKIEIEREKGENQR